MRNLRHEHVGRLHSMGWVVLIVVLPKYIPVIEEQHVALLIVMRMVER